MQDCGACCKGCFGGEIKTLSKLTMESRQDLLSELEVKAREMGANAVVGINMETNSVWDGTLDIVVFGTAVKVTREKM